MISIISGIITGILLAQFADSQVERDVNAYLQNTKDFQNDWGAPGFTFRDHQDINNELHILRLNTHDWVKKLGFIHPIQYENAQTKPDTKIDKYADLNSLMYDTTSGSRPREQWVYISGHVFPRWNPWDGAFDAAIQAAYVPSALNDTNLFFVACGTTGSFLCGVWGVESPALIHFLIEDDPPQHKDMYEGLTYTTSLSKLRPVTARVVELPLQDVYTGGSSTTFPSEKNQILAIMSGKRLYEQFDHWDAGSQLLTRFDNYMTKLYQTKGTWLYHLGNVQSWVETTIFDPLGVATMHQVIFSMNMLTGGLITRILVLWPWHWVKDFVLDYLGYPSLATRIMAQNKYDNPVEEMVADMFNGMMGIPDMLGDLIKNLENQKNDPYFRRSFTDPPSSQSTATAMHASSRLQEELKEASSLYFDSPRSIEDFQKLVKSKKSASSRFSATVSA